MVAKISNKFYRLLLKSYPRQFYEQFGPEMVSVFADQCREAQEKAGHVGLLRLWLRTLVDFAINVPAEYRMQWLEGYGREKVMLRRMIDMLLGLVGVLVGLWFLPIIALLIKLDSSGPVFYIAERIGKDGKLFPLYKLRSMTNDESRRITRVGRILRWSQLDEWPQFYNLFNGSMTLFGPPPGKPGDEVIYTRKPGIIG